MPNISLCQKCKYFSGSLYLSCAVHPEEMNHNYCDDLESIFDSKEEEIWAPIGWTFINGELRKKD